MNSKIFLCFLCFIPSQRTYTYNFHLITVHTCQSNKIEPTPLKTHLSLRKSWANYRKTKIQSTGTLFHSKKPQPLEPIISLKWFVRSARTKCLVEPLIPPVWYSVNVITCEFVDRVKCASSVPYVNLLRE